MSGDRLVAAIRGYIDPALDSLHQRIDGMPAPRDGRDGRDGSKGEDGKDGQPGKDGQDGLGFEDLEVVHDGERTVTLRFARGDQVKEFPIVFPVVLDRGVYRQGEAYARGDAVTFGGSLFIAQEPTGEKPETGGSWRLAVKRGRDGREAKVKANGSAGHHA